MPVTLKAALVASDVGSQCLKAAIALVRADCDLLLYAGGQLKPLACGAEHALMYGWWHAVVGDIEEAYLAAGEVQCTGDLVLRAGWLASGDGKRCHDGGVVPQRDRAVQQCQ